MRRILLCLFMSGSALLAQSQDNTYIQNQRAAAQSADAWINGRFTSSYVQTFRGTGTNPDGVSHHDFFGGAATPAGVNLRWRMVLQGAESGSNTGSDFRICSYQDDGTLLLNPFSISRASGIVSIASLAGKTISSNNSQGALSIYGGAAGVDSYRGAEIGLRGGTYSSTPGELSFHTGTGGGGVSQPERMRIDANGLVTIANGLSFTNTNSPFLDFAPSGLGAPTYNSRSIGSKISLRSGVPGPSSAGWDIGMEGNHMWFGVPSQFNTQGFKFYAGISQVGRLDGFGALDLGGQGRFKGWYTANGTGMAAEIGVTAANIASLIGFDRTTGATKYIPLQLAGGTTSSNQTILLLNEKGATIAPGNTAVNPQTALSVNGLITARQVKVTQTGWADYVFHKNYQLPTLAEVEKYVDTHQHLEGIPSAAEVEKEGIDVGDMNKKLLAKIEELTLYLIEQNKKIAALEVWKMQQEKKTK